jgi:tetratricopeptide (TPR) repeat protein
MSVLFTKLAKRQRTFFLAAAAIFVVCFFLAGGLRGIERAWVFTIEDILYAVDPSAERAFQYGSRHFSSKEPAQYDIDRAEYFFNLAAVKDPTILYLYHQLARISFLRGDFTGAMTQINYQISTHGDATPNSYYIRGLIEGYMGDYENSARDYEYFLRFDPRNWAALNDYAWVLLKAERFHDAAVATARGLIDFPDNPWLLNSHAIALFELHQYEDALLYARKASAAVATLSEAEWLHAYPGNDPKIGDDGLATFKKAVADNMHTIELAIASGTVQ